MARRSAPPADAVAGVLDPVRRAAERVERAQRDLTAAVRAAHESDPQPTYRQIGEAARGRSADAIRAMVNGRRS